MDYLNVSIDYLTIRVRGYNSIIEVLHSVLQLRLEIFQKRNGQYGYNRALRYGNISLLYDGTEEMGFCVQLSGRGCEEYCELQNNPNAVFDLLERLNKDAVVTRLDIAIDDFIGILDLAVISNLSPECVRTKLESSTDIRKRKIKNKKDIGHTLYFGSSQSDYCIRFYDKAAQRETEGHWIRVEQQIRHELANAVAKEFIQQIT